MANRKQVRDAHGSVQCLTNLCELAAGMVTEVTIPPTLTWVTRGMTIEYLRRAHTGVTATARLDKTEWSDTQNVGVPMSVVDDNGAEVVRAVISINVSARAGCLIIRRVTPRGSSSRQKPRFLPAETERLSAKGAAGDFFQRTIPIAFSGWRSRSPNPRVVARWSGD